MEVIIGWFLFSIIPAVIASNKGRSTVGWYITSLVVSPLFAGLLVLVLAPIKKGTPGAQGEPADDRLPCPLCKEQVKFGAVRCPHCQGDISEFMGEQVAARRRTEETSREKESGEMAGLSADQLLNIVRYKKFPEEKRRTAIERLQQQYPGSRELSEALKALPPTPMGGSQKGSSSNQSTPSAPLVNLPGPGTYSVDVVGESHYQTELGQICGGRTREGHRLTVEVYLVPEDDNPHDDQAVRVYVREKTVGYLSREVARSYRKRLAEAGYPGSPATCSAIIVGGWDKGGGDQGHFGVKVDLPTG